MENRRNWYRILHVQPDAPLAIIKSSYRTLMQTLKFHPDLGGDDWNAILVNQAYAVLSDEKLRAEYDKKLLQQAYERQLVKQTGQKVEKLPVLPLEIQEKSKIYLQSACVFCKSIFWESGELAIGNCPDCQSPLQMIEIEKSRSRVLGRLEKQEKGVFYTYWPSESKQAILFDVTPMGIGLFAQDWLPYGQRIKIVFPFVEGVAELKHLSWDEEKEIYRLGMVLLTARFSETRGSFLNVAG